MLWSLVGLVVAFLGAQLVPVTRVNPPVQSDLAAPDGVKTVLRRACYDCHSNETVWPWYSYVAPVSWLVADDVNHGRRHVNFSTWSSMPADRQAKTLREIGEQVESGEMPLWYYLPMHPAARLSDADKALLRDWTHDASAR